MGMNLPQTMGEGEKERCQETHEGRERRKGAGGEKQ